MAVTFNSQEAAWSDVSISLFGAKCSGARGIAYEKKADKEHIFGAGDEPLTIGSGNKEYSGTLTLLKNNYDKLNEAAMSAGYDDITSVPAQLVFITVSYKSGYNRPKITKVLNGVSFTTSEEGLKQGDKFMEIQLPFLFLGISILP